MSRTPLLLVSLVVVGCGKKADEATVQGTPEPTQEARLQVDEPAEGAHVPVGALTVKGTQQGLVGTTVNGEPLDALSGDFEVQIDAVRGVNTLEVRGEQGAVVRLDRRSVLAGSFADADGAIESALGMRLNQGGLDTVGGMVGGLVDPSGLSKSLAAANPVYESTVVDLHVLSLDFDPLVLDLHPSQGELAVDVLLPNVDILMLVDTLGDFEATVTADSARISGVITLGTDGQGHLTAGFTDAWVELDNLDLDTSLLPGDLTFGVEELLQGTVEDLLQEQVSAALPSLLADQLSTLELAFDLDLLGVPVSIGTAFRGASIDDAGVQLLADLEVDVPSNGTKQAPGYLTANDQGSPTPDKVSDLSVALSDDLVNRLLFEVWTGGLVDLTLSTEEGTLPADYLADFGMSEGALVLDARLPPVLVQNGADTELQVGELQVRLEAYDSADFTYIDLALAAKVPVDLEVQGGALTIAMGAAQLDFVVRDSDWDVDHDWLTETLAANLPVDVLLAALGPLEIELPELGGFVLTDAAIDRDATGAHTNIHVDLP
jgi:hypothetical protein